MQTQANFQTGLNAYFQKRKEINPSFSLRAFSKIIGISPSSVSEIISGKRRVTKKKAFEIIDRLKLTPDERNRILRDFETSSRSLQKVNLLPKTLTEDQYDIIIDPIYFTILSLVSTTGFNSDIEQMAQKLDKEIPDVWRALIKLQEKKLISIDTNRNITRLPNPVFTSDDVPSDKIKQMHLSDMNLAAKKILDVPVELRDYTNVTFPANPKLLPRAKEILRRAQDELEELLKEDPSEVYRLCMYLFPLTKVINNEKE